jgi:hypothetical protein
MIHFIYLAKKIIYSKNNIFIFSLKYIMDEIMDKIKQNRENLSASSLKTYRSILRNIFKSVYPDDDSFSMNKFNNHELILEHLKDLPSNKRKTKLAPLFVLTGNKHYHTEMTTDIKKYNDEQDKQEMTDYFRDNMVSVDEVMEKFKMLERNMKILLSKERLTTNDYQEIQKCIMLALMGGIFQPPRRSSDWVMKFRNYNPETDNYVDMKKGIFVFRNFKTSKVYGNQTMEINKELKKLLMKWFKIIPENCDWILFDTNFNHLTNSQMTHRLNAIFGKKVSTSMLRHIYLTNKFSNVDLQELKETSEAMGNSPLQALKYVKREKPDKGDDF